nr:hypothetical protein [uncultured Mediterranean phage uvMED]BAR23550.1 hypothetical protein [uncultured Mediterranean phage uvMED]
MSVFHNNALIGSGAAAGAAAAAGPIKSVRFSSGDSAYLNRTPSSEGNRRTWTWSAWIKLGKLSNWGSLFKAGASTSNPTTQLYLYSDGTLEYITYDYQTTGKLTTSQVFRDPSAWYHIVLALDTTNATADNRQRLYINGVEVTEFGNRTNHAQNYQVYVNSTYAHEIGRTTNIGGSSQKFFDGYIADCFLIDGSQLDPTSFGAFDNNGVWQAAEYDGTFGTNGFHLLDFANEATIGHDSSGNENDFTANNIATGNTFSTNLTPSSTAYPNTTLSNGGLSWSGSTSNDTGTVSSLTIPTNKKTYVEVTHTTTGGGDPGPGVAQGPTVELGLDSVKAWWRGGTNGSISASTLGSFSGTNTSWSNGDVLGIALDNTANSGAGSITFYKNGTQIHTGGSGWTSYTDLRFEWQNNGSGTSSGTWNYGASSFSYPVSGHTGLFEEAGANEDVLFDVPTNGTQSDTGAGGEVSGNYCTLNPLDTKLIHSNGNLDATASTSQTWVTGRGNMAMTSGKFYWEVTINSLSTTSDTAVQLGIGALTAALPSNDGAADSNAYVYLNSNGQKMSGGSAASYGASYTTGDVIGVAFDADAGTLVFYKNGSSQGTAYSSLDSDKRYAPLVSLGRSSTSTSVSFNAGQRAWAYSAPSNHKPLCTALLPTPTIADGSTAFDAVTYTGNNSTQTISGLDFSSDFVWLKRRSGAAHHHLYDIVRGATKRLQSSTTNTESTAVGGVTAFNSDGWTMGNDADINGSSNTFVGWTWDAGSSTVSNTDGSVTSSVRANQSAGFSIVTYTGNFTAGATVGHGLNVKPEFILFKNRTSTTGWGVYHSAIGATHKLRINSDEAASSTGLFETTEPTSSVFTVGDSVSTNESGANHVAYCFADVPGYQRISQYTGTGSSGNMVVTDFAPAFVLIKGSSHSGDWTIYDIARGNDNYLSPNKSDAEENYFTKDFTFLSNGFVFEGNDNSVNASGRTYIYYAVASNPFQANGGLAR